MTTPFGEFRLDTKITAGAQIKMKNPGRIKIYTESGDLTQKFSASAPKHELVMSHGLRSAADWQVLFDLGYVVQFTPYCGFRVRMQNDYIATQANTKATLITGSTTVLQLQRAHRYGGITLLRNIYKPCALPVPAVYRTRSGSTSLIASSVDTTTGLATISGHAGGDTYTWAGEFDLPMTFFDNEWSGTLEVNTQNLHIMANPITLEELRRKGALAT